MIDSPLEVLFLFLVGVAGFIVGYGLGSARSYKHYRKKNDCPPTPRDRATPPPDVTISIMDGKRGPVYPDTAPKSYVMYGGVLYPV